MKKEKIVPLNIILQHMQDELVNEIYKFTQALVFFNTTKLETSMIMASSKDIYNTDFYLGEVLVTVCELECSKKIGWGCVHGESEKKAFISAAFDFFENCGDEFKNEREKFMSFIADKQKSVIEKIELEMKMASATKVNFGTMVEG